MTLKEFMEMYDINKDKLVNNWIEKGWIPSVKTDPQTNEIIIPDNARPPYTNTDTNLWFATLGGKYP